MRDVALFLGFPIDPAYANVLAGADPQLLQMFLYDTTSNYLTETQCDGLRYLGKYLGAITTMAHLDLLQNNIYSILQRLTPQHHFARVPLTLLAISRPQ